jgi:hypothetical protein
MSISISNPHHTSSALMCISLTACRVAVRAGTDKWRVRRAACVFATCIHSAHTACPSNGALSVPVTFGYPRHVTIRRPAVFQACIFIISMEFFDILISSGCVR